jgi:hypothetical protein
MVVILSGVVVRMVVVVPVVVRVVVVVPATCDARSNSSQEDRMEKKVISVHGMFKDGAPSIS